MRMKKIEGVYSVICIRKIYGNHILRKNLNFNLNEDVVKLNFATSLIKNEDEKNRRSV